MTDRAPPNTSRDPDAERVIAAMERWRRRSRLIRFFRRALPIAIGAVVSLLFGWVVLKSVLANLAEPKTGGAVIRMTNPRFYGQDSHGRSFVLGAREATRSSKTSETIELIDPLLRLSVSAAKATELTAKRGVYDQVTRQARLTGAVRVADAGSGFVFETGEALVDTRTGTVSGNSPIRGRGPLGQISASSYAIYDQGARVIFTGNVHERIEQGRR